MTTSPRSTTTARWWMAAFAAVATASLAFAGATSASARATKTEHFNFMSDSTTDPHPTFSVIANGAFTAGGTATVDHGTITLSLPKGTITLHGTNDHVTTYSTPGCLQEKTTSGHYTIASGTGAYHGISGTGTTHTTVRAVESKSRGRCSSSFDAIQFIGTASGPTTLP